MSCMSRIAYAVLPCVFVCLATLSASGQAETLPAAPAASSSTGVVIAWVASVIGAVFLVPLLKMLGPVMLKKAEAAASVGEAAAKAEAERETARVRREAANEEFIRSLVTKYSEGQDRARTEFLAALERLRVEFSATLSDIAASIRSCPLNGLSVAGQAAAIAAAKETSRGT